VKLIGGESLRESSFLLQIRNSED